MANKQSVPQNQLGGAVLRQPVKNVALASGGERAIDDGEFLELNTMLEAGKMVAQKQLALEDKNMRLQTAATLGNLRQQLWNTKSQDEFDMLADSAKTVLDSQFEGDEKGQKFWQENGGKIIAANRNDMERIRQIKATEFGKNSLDELLANSQNVVAQTPSIYSSDILEDGLREIEQSSFLSDAEKDIYRQNYLNSGVLNLALNNPQAAEQMLEKYLPQDEALKTKIATTKELMARAKEKDDETKARENYLAQLGQSVALWQKKEKGEISDAVFYVLKNQYGDDFWVADSEVEKDASPLSRAYQLFKRKNRGEVLTNQEIKQAENCLMSAYKQRKIGLDEVSSLQNQFLAMMGDGATYDGYDYQIDDLSDRVLLPDTEEQSMEGKLFMEDKARFSFELYDAYGAKKTALVNQFIKDGGTLSPSVLRRFEREAKIAVREELGLKESAYEVSFGELKEVMNNIYSGRDKMTVWQKFLKEAPFVQDKKGLMQKVAAGAQKQELRIPRFSSIEELKGANLSYGQKFYLNGRLAIKS